MLDVNIVARSHFTRSVDQETAFWQFKKEIGILDDIYPFKFKSGISRGKSELYFVAESWGGYFDADNNWRVFLSWRLSNGKVTKWVVWYWDAENKCVTGKQEHSTAN